MGGPTRRALVIGVSRFGPDPEPGEEPELSARPALPYVPELAPRVAQALKVFGYESDLVLESLISCVVGKSIALLPLRNRGSERIAHAPVCHRHFESSGFHVCPLAALVAGLHHSPGSSRFANRHSSRDLAARGSVSISVRSSHPLSLTL